MSLFNSLLKSSLPSFDSLRKSIDDMVGEMNHMFDDDTFDKHFDSLKKSLKKITKRIKNLTDRYEIEFPYDRNTQKMSYLVEEDRVSIDVTSLDEHSVTYHLDADLPQNVATDSVTLHYDDENKKMILRLKKQVVDNEVDTEINDEAAESEDAPTTEEETSTTRTKEDLIAQVTSLFSNGWSYKRIAREVGVSDKTVARWIKKYAK